MKWLDESAAGQPLRGHPDLDEMGIIGAAVNADLPHKNKTSVVPISRHGDPVSLAGLSLVREGTGKNACLTKAVSRTKDFSNSFKGGIR